MSHGAEVEIEAPRAFTSAAFHVRDSQRPMGLEQRFLAAQEVTTAATTGLHANREVHVAVVLDRDRVVWVATGLGPFDRSLLNHPHCDDENRDEGGTANCQRHHAQAALRSDCLPSGSSTPLGTALRGCAATGVAPRIPVLSGRGDIGSF